MYRTVEFNSTIPNTWKFNEDGAPIAPGARDLADAIARELATEAEEVSPVEQHSFYGWEVEVLFQGGRFENVLNPIAEDCYFTVGLRWYFLRWLMGKRPKVTLDRYCEAVTRALGRIPAVSDVHWLKGYQVGVNEPMR